MTLSSDTPISEPGDDRFGLDPFARSLARTIQSATASSGIVLAVTGPWGSGKSSAISLARHHLKGAEERGEIVVVPFNPWWFTGADTLTLSFFQELNTAIGPTLPKAARKSLAAMGRGVSAIGAIAGALANLKAPGLGEVIGGFANFVGKLTADDTTVDEEHRRVSEALRAQDKKFLVIIDDIDRLNPDDALTIFRLVKSVGRLPNVIYLLAFDRQIAERLVAERFPSEGPSYLEKIIQAAFELPPAPVDVLRQQVLEAAIGILGELGTQEKQVRFLNIFYDAVAPLIRTPRDVVRLRNQLAGAWPPVAGNVDRADFLAITALQLREPWLYAAIRDNSDALTGVGDRDMRRDVRNLPQEYDELLGLAGRPERERSRLKTALRRLFPRLDSVWANTWHSDADRWRRDRLIASPEHFQSYFAFAVGGDVLPADQIEALLAKAAEPAFVRAAFREALARKRPTGSTEAALLLEELTVQAETFPAAGIPAFVETLFGLVDELDVDSDKVRAMSIGDNKLRVHWLLNRLVHDRFALADRDGIYAGAMPRASLRWACDFAERCLGPFEKELAEGQKRHAPIVSEPVAESFRELCLTNLRVAAQDGTLVRHPHLRSLLFDWLRLSGSASEPGAFVEANFGDDAFILALARQIPSESWSHGMGFDGMGDRVSQRHVLIDYSQYEGLLNGKRMDQRVREIVDAGQAEPEDLAMLRDFLATRRGSHGRLRHSDDEEVEDNPSEATPET